MTVQDRTPPNAYVRIYRHDNSWPIDKMLGKYCEGCGHAVEEGITLKTKTGQFRTLWCLRCVTLLPQKIHEQLEKMTAEDAKKTAS